MTPLQPGCFYLSDPFPCRPPDPAGKEKAQRSEPQRSSSVAKARGWVKERVMRWRGRVICIFCYSSRLKGWVGSHPHIHFLRSKKRGAGYPAPCRLANPALPFYFRQLSRFCRTLKSSWRLARCNKADKKYSTHLKTARLLSGGWL